VFSRRVCAATRTEAGRGRAVDLAAHGAFGEPDPVGDGPLAERPGVCVDDREHQELGQRDATFAPELRPLLVTPSLLSRSAP
jgi:hypothetical protein